MITLKRMARASFILNVVILSVFVLSVVVPRYYHRAILVLPSSEQGSFTGIN